MDVNKVQQRVCRALVDLYRHDKELLHINASERSITHKLAEHLQRQFHEHHVDCEYNRHGENIKRLKLDFDQIAADDLEAKTVFPDIIVHKRTTADDNLLVIEVKKSGNGAEEKDLKKLKQFVDGQQFHYEFGLFLRLGKDGCEEARLIQTGRNATYWNPFVREAVSYER